MIITAALKHWRWLAMAALAAGWLYTAHALQAERADHAATQAAAAQERAAAQAAALTATQAIRQAEQELAHVTDQHAQAQAQLAAERRSRADGARAADGRVRSAAKAYASAAGARCPNPAPAANEPTAAEALDLLAGLLDRVGSRKTELAEFADASHAAATACAADYDRAREALNGE